MPHPSTSFNAIFLPSGLQETFVLDEDHAGAMNTVEVTSETLPLHPCWHVTVRVIDGHVILNAYIPRGPELADATWRMLEQQYLLMGKTWIRQGMVEDADIASMPPFPWLASIVFPEADGPEIEAAKAVLLLFLREKFGGAR